jgi:TonB-linked SusC/RagA family outer membrane protein
MNNPLKKVTITFVLILLFTSFLPAQSLKKTVALSGFITAFNTGEKLAGVNVYLKGTTIGIMTNESGYYSFKIPEGTSIVVFSFIGYRTLEKEINLKEDQVLNMILNQNDEIIQEIKITSQRKFFGNMDYGRDIPTVKSKEIEKINSTNASDILHARIAGVWATKTSGAPGDQQKIRIRGQASFFSSSEPLYVIDGVPVPIVNMASLGIGDLNMHDIESVTVLKDASSSALYGYQGGNGVILIDTKQRIDSRINFLYRNGIQWFNNYYDLMNTNDFLQSLQLAKQTIKSPIYKYYPLDADTLCDHNRQNEIFQFGRLQEFQLSGSGKVSGINYYLSGNYSTHKGVVNSSEYDKYNFAARLGTTINNKLAITFSYRWSYQDNKNNQNEYMGNRLIFEGISKAPCLECIPDSLLYDENFQLNNRCNPFYGLLNTLDTPLQIIRNNSISYNYFSNAGSLMMRYAISKNFSIDIMESMMVRDSKFLIVSSYNSVYYDRYSNGYPFMSVAVNKNSDERVALFNHQINLSYNKFVNNHEFSVLMANRFYADNINWKNNENDSYVPSGFFLRNSMAGVSNEGSVIRRMGSYITHLSYNFRRAYFISAIANLSRIREGMHIDYYTLFPSVSASWNIAKIPCLIDWKWLNDMSIYSNYGSAGNYPLNGLANDVYQPSLGEWNFFMLNTDSSHLIVNQFANHHLKHESNTEFNLGLKSAFMSSRLKVNAVFFSKAIGNQIVMRDIPEYYAGGKMFVNLGDVSVKGYEVGFEAYPVVSKDIDLTLAGNFSTSRQTVKSIADHKDMRFISDDLLLPDFIIKEGDVLGNIYGYKCLGKWTKQDDLANDIKYLNVGGYKFLNIDATNRRLDENDKTVIGNSIPKFNWNLLGSFRYKEFGLDFVVYSVWGIQKYNATRAGTYITGVNREVNQFYADTVSVLKYNPIYQSSFFIEDAGFIRLKTVTLSYQPLKKIIGLKYQFSLSFENLFTYTNYKGYDPEATIYTDNNFSDNAIDRGAYPNPKSVFATINIKF